MQTRNIKRFTHATLGLMLSLLMSVSFVACDDDDDDSSSSFRLESFGPSPAMRGGELIFIGSKMNSVESVEFSNGVIVSELTFESNEKFRITIPQDAEPGYVTLHTSSDDVKTKTQVAFTEPITFASFSKTEALPGDEITINGEYLMSVTSVEFPSGNVVADSSFIEQTKNLIKLVVPEAAQTGKLCLSDGSNLVYTSSELAITLPVFTSLSKAENVYPGVDEITISGTNLNLVYKVVFAGGSVILTDSKSVVVSDKEITFTVPANAQSGDIKMYPLSDIECAAGSISVVAPVVNKFAELEGGMFKDMTTKYYLGSEYTMTGTNLDLIASVSCGDGTTTEFKLNSDNTSLTFVIPKDATATNWTTEFGCAGQMYPDWRTAFIVSVTSKQDVKTPVGVLFDDYGEQLSGANQSEIGGDVIVKGPNPKMPTYVVSMTLNGVAVQFTPNADGTITIPKVDARYSTNAAIACVFTNKVNGSCSGTMVKPEYNFITNIPSELIAGKLIQIDGENFSGDTKLYFGDIQVTSLAVQDSKTIYCTLPKELSGKYTVKAVDSKGTYIWPEQVEVAGSLLVVYDGNGALSWDKDKGGSDKGVDIASVTKINIYVTWTGAGEGWIGILSQNKAGKNLWAGQKDINGLSDFDISTGSYKLVVPASEFDMTTAETIDGTDWYICGGGNAENVKIEKITAEF